MLRGKLKKNCVENGEGVRLSVFVAGCSRQCYNCHNPEFWDFEAGEELSEREIFDELAKKHYQGMTILGGEPLDPKNVDDVYALVNLSKFILPNKDIWLYTGYDYEEVKDNKVLRFVDVLVDGSYEESKKVNGEMYGSSNQNIIRL